jgi:PAS domain S-box-containing protein
MNTLSVAVLSALISSGVLTGVTAALHRSSPSASLRSWTVAWVLNAGWLGGELALTLSVGNGWVVIPAMLLRIASAFFLLLGTMQLLGRSVGPVSYAIFGVAAAWVALSWLGPFPYPVTVAPAALLMGGALIAMGAALMRSPQRGAGTTLLGIATVALGLHHVDYVFLRELEIAALIGFLVLHGLAIAVGIGLLAEYQDRVKRLIAASEERFRSLVQSVDDVVFVLDREGRHVQLHGRWREHELVPRDAYLGKTAAEVVGEEEGRIHMEYHRRAMAEGPQKFEWTFTDRSGRRWVEINLTPVRDDSGRVIGTVGVSRDITHLRRAQQELEAEISQNRVLLKEVHHRSKNNMQIMSSILLLQARHAEQDDPQAALVESARRIETMAAVHEQLYAQTNVAEIDMREFTEQTVARLERLYCGPESYVVTSVEADELSLPLDAALPCAQILQELVSNAFRHAFAERTAGSVVVRLAKADGRVRLTVRDNGRGLPSHVLDDDGRVREIGSLGLVLVELLAHQIGGRLDIDVDRGTTVSLTFPVPSSQPSGHGIPDVKHERVGD